MVILLSVTTILRSSVYVLLGAIVLASPQPAATQEPVQTLLQGFVMATDSCQLAPADWSGLCSSVVIPIEGELRLRKRGSVHRTVISLDPAGSFTEKLEPGSYRVRLLEPRVADRQLKRSAYRIYPRQLRIARAAPGRARAASQAHVFLVAHRSRGVPPSIGISDGFDKG